MTWKLVPINDVSVKSPVFIEGLPGIGNVGKVVVDFLIEQSRAIPLTSFFSHTLPNSVFVNEHNIVELPEIILYHAKIKDKDFLFMTGDVQPHEERSSYSFCEETLSICRKHSVSHIITLGGIGLQEAPIDPQVYCVGNQEGVVSQAVQAGANNEVYGIVGPIIGVSGLLLGLARKKDIPAYALLGETMGHPMYLGLRGAKAILNILFSLFDFSYDLSSLDDEIRELEEAPKAPRPRIDAINKLKRYQDTNYIG
jgi:uncharacterized protein